jgi:hypothetical protein
MAVFASLWLLCVGVVGAAAWYAIDSAGRTTQVLASENRGARAVPAGSSTTAAARPTTDPAEPSEPDDDPSSTSSEPEDGTSSSTSASSSSTRPSDGGTNRTTSSRPSSRPTSSRPTRTTTTTTTTTSDARTMLQQTAGGSVTVTCRRDTPIDYVAKPAQGWSVRTNTQGATEAVIKFSDGDQTYEVHAKCAAGEPSATVEHKSNDD